MQMSDSPLVDNLLEASRVFLERDLLPSLMEDAWMRERTQVTIETLAIVQRELRLSAEQLQAEWRRLNFVQRTDIPMPSDPDEARAALNERNRKLCDEIAAGRYDYQPQRAALFEHLLVTTRGQIEVSNPDFLRELVLEDQQPHDA
jgi:hypothetical protein